MEYNVEPYYDDFETNAKENNYLRLLFKPGYSVQARELTQIQSLLQNQIKSFADHIFQDGSPVIGGNISLDNRVFYLKLEETYNNEDIEIDTFVNKVIIRDPDALVQAKTIAAYYPSGGTPTLLVKYLTGNEFEDGEVFYIAGTTQKAKLISSNATGKGSAASINDGIFYVDGYFVQVQTQDIVIDAYGQNANVKVGLEITDDVVDYLIDTSLLDPAQDAFNYQAPGADRYQFNLNLSTRPLETAVDESTFFELMRIENGAVTKQVKYPIYSEIEKTLARRTYDESGDYTVTPFRASTANSASSDKYVLEIDAGKAYVKGYEFETIGKLSITADKPRSATDQRTVFEAGIDTQYGNYLRVKRVFGNTSPAGLFNIDSLDEVDIHCVPSVNVAAGVRGGAVASYGQYSNTKIGTARVRNIKRYQPQIVDTLNGVVTGTIPSGDSNGIYNLYITDVNIQPKVFKLAAGGSANTIVLPSTAPSYDNAYTNMTITVMPYKLSTVANGNVNIAYAPYVWRHGSNTTNLRTLVNVGDTIRFGDETRVAVLVRANNIVVDRKWISPFQSGGAYGDRFIEKQVPYSSNVTSQTRTIVRYDGTSRTAYLDKAFDDNAVASANTVVQLNPKLKDIESIVKSNFSSLTAATVAASADIYAASKNAIGDVYLEENDYKSLIFRLPKQYVQRSVAGSTSLQNVDYYNNKYISSVTVTSNQFTIEPGSYLSVGSERIDWLPTNSNIEDNLLVIVKNKGTATTVSNGEIIRLNTNHVTLSGLGTGITVDLSASSSNAAGVSEVAAYVVVRLDNVENNVRRKTFVSNTQYTLDPVYNYPTNPTTIPGIIDVSRVLGDVDPYSSTTQVVASIDANNGLIFLRSSVTGSIGAGDSISLYVPDVARVRRILKGNTTNYPTSSTYTDITDNFIFDGGQRDEIYDHAKLILKQGYPTPNARILVHVDYYKHTEDSSNTFFTVDSYSQAEYETGTIPIFFSRKYGKYNLQDCIDMRPSRKFADSSGVVSSGRLSDPDSIVIATFKYWLPRIDKLVLSKTKEFKIIKGISDPSPLPPDDDSDSMTLYTIYLPPYVHNVGEIGLKYNENKRYTMQDISALDKRIQRVEYYTSLNNIENRTLADPAFYKDSTKKEKYGLVGESFEDYDIAAYKSADFTVSKTSKGITARSETRILDLKPYSYTNTQKNNKTISLAYTETPAISQPLASNTGISVQPFLFASFIGSISLSPEMDYWVSEELKPEIIRAPAQSTTIIEKTTIHEVIREIIVEKIERIETITFLPNPSTNANTTIANSGEDLIAAPEDDIIVIDTNPYGGGSNIVTINDTRPTQPITPIQTVNVAPPWTGLSESIVNGMFFPMPILDFGTGFLNVTIPAGIGGIDTTQAISYDSSAYTAPTYAPPAGGQRRERDSDVGGGGR